MTETEEKAPKVPAFPLKPTKPHKPHEGSYQMGETTKGRIDLASERSSFDLDTSLANLLDKVEPEVMAALTINDLHISISTEIEYGYYDSQSSIFILNLYTEKDVPNSKMEAEKTRYAKDLEVYETRKAKYKEANKTYKAKMKEYNEAEAKWQIWNAKKTLKKLGAEEETI